MSNFVQDLMKAYSPSPTLKRFHESTAFYRLIAGPIGSGKTSGAGCVEMALGVMAQNPMPDGIRRAKFGVLRDTYRNMYSQFIPSWFEWFPKEIGNFVGSDDRPATHSLILPNAPIWKNGKVVGYGDCELTVEMKAIGSNSVETTCQGWNLTGLFLDEMDKIPEQSMSFLAGRVMRWPAKPFRVSKGVWGVFNKPDVDHWLYRWCVDDPPPDLEYFEQPPGLIKGTLKTNPKAENLERLDDDYYEKQAKNSPTHYVVRMIRNEWGASVSGELIYPEFRAELHMLPTEIEPPAGSELVLGIDGGGTPAAVIGGRDHFGRRIIYAEVVIFDPHDPKRQKLLTGCGPKRFAEALRDALWPRFRGCRISIGYADPAMFYGTDREMGEFASIETIGQQLGIPIISAPSNEVSLRHQAVHDGLGSLASDGFPMLRFNPSCRWLRRGFTSDYKWQEVDKDKPGATIKAQKSATSHVHDGLQYFCLGDVGRAGVTGGMKHDRYYQNPQPTLIGHNGGPPMGSYDSHFNVFDV